MIRSLLEAGRRRKFDGVPNLILMLAGAVFAAGVVYANIFALPDALLIGILFVCGVYSLLFLTTGANRRSPETPSLMDWVLTVASVACGIYFFAIRDTLATHITLLYDLTADQMFFGALLLGLTLEATRRTTGPGLTAVVLIFLVYNLYGHVLPPPLGHGYIDFGAFIDTLMYTTDGVFGVPIQVTASYVFLFVMFGAILSRAGGAEFMFQLAAALTGRSPGGPAKIAVVSSGMYGMISGSPTSDVATTGVVTIPIMKRLGYSARFAGAVEVAASTGGAAMPPVMGSAAFILAEYTGIDYRTIVISAIIPALLYYFGVYLQVHMRALRRGLAGFDGVDPVLETLRTGWVFIIPVAVISITLLMGNPPTNVAVYGTVALIVSSMFSKKTRMSPRQILEGMGEATLRILPVAGACAAAGLVIGGLTMTGLSMKASTIVTLVAGGGVIPLLVLAAIITTILGLGMPTPSAYILAAVLVGPAFVTAGLPVLPSNMFLLFYALLSALTPPIAVAAFAAAAIADEDAFKISVTAVKLAAVGFLLPFFFVWNGAILAQGDLLAIGVAAVGGVTAVVLLALALEAQMALPVRIGLLAYAAAVLSPYLVVSVPLIVLAAGALVWWSQRGRTSVFGIHLAPMPPVQHT